MKRGGQSTNHTSVHQAIAMCHNSPSHDICSKSALSHGNGPLTRYGKLRVAHAPGMPGTFPPPPWVCDPDMHHGTCVTHVPGCMLGLLSSAFFWSRWRGKHSRHSRRMCNLQFSVSGKRPIRPTTLTDDKQNPELWYRYIKQNTASY